MGGSVWLSVAVTGAVGLAAAAQVLSGVGFALIASPLLIAALGHLEGLRLTLLLSVVLNVIVLTHNIRAVRWGDALRLFIPAAVLVVPTLVVSAHLSSAAVSAAAGLVILFAVGLVAGGRRAGWVQRPVGAVAAGATSGVLNVLAGTSGPPVALFVAHRGWPPRVAAATLQAYALPLNVLTLAVIGLPTTQPGRLVWAAVGLLVGAAAGWPLVTRVTPARVRALTLTVAAAGATLLVIQATT